VAYFPLVGTLESGCGKVIIGCELFLPHHFQQLTDSMEQSS